MTLTPMQQRHENDIDGLAIVAMFRWIRVQELGHLMRPNRDRHGYVQASQMVKSWVERDLVILRKLPGRAGSVCVLATAGVRMLSTAGITSKTGKDVGKETADGWIPGNRWRHDLLCHGVLVRLAALGYDIYPEYKIRQGGLLAKIPDGLAVKGKDVLVIEVERAHKGGTKDRSTGRPGDGKALGEFICAVSGRRAEKILGHVPTRIGVVFDQDEKDTRGANINHKVKVTSLIKKVAKQNVTVTWFAVKTQNHGVISMNESQAVIQADLSLKILQTLNSGGWHHLHKSEQECYRVFGNYGQHTVEVMLDASQSEPGDWCWCVRDHLFPEGYQWRSADSEADAKSKAASYLVDLTARSKVRA